jgi:putative ABC transport system substrate-binding protein
VNRRAFITLVGGAAGWPLAARAQQVGKVWRIGILVGQSRQAPFPQYDGFVQGMRELGYVEGRDFVSEIRFADGHYERVPELVAELVRLKVDVLFTGLTAALRALQQATRIIPIVFVSITDPVGQGFVASLAHPGGNTTGLAGSFDDTSPKRLELLAAVAPGASRIGVLYNPDNPSNAFSLNMEQEAAKRAGLMVVPVEARDAEGIEKAFASFERAYVQAVMVEGDAYLRGQNGQIAGLALKARLPSISPQLEYVQAGGLMGYGESLSDFFRRGASYVDRILKGAKPADLPVELPTRFHLAINRKTADMLGIAIPPALYIFADEVIE